MVTVLIPTVCRPAFLRMALQSVAEQTAVGRIGRIVVSENGGDPASWEVCREFPQLPIAYFSRHPCLPSLDHAQVLMRECLEGEITCILHDDDWWLPNHLENALSALAAHPDASAYGANPVMLVEDVLTDAQCDAFAWFGANYPPPDPVWRLSSSNILLASLLGLVVRYSALVMRTDALRQSAFIYELCNPFDNDRMLLFALSQCGPVLYNNKMGVGIRVHHNRDTTRFDRDERCRHMSRTTEWMIERSRKPWSVIAALFVQRLGRCPVEERKIYFIREAVIRPWCLPEIARHLDRATETEFFAMYDKAQATFAGEKPQEDR